MSDGRRSRTVSLVIAASVAALATGCTIEARTDRPGATAAADTPHKEIVEVPGVARLPTFSSGVRSGDFIFLSGAIGALPGTPITLVEGGAGPQTRQALENLRTVLEAAGASMADVVKCTVFLADMADYDAMNEAYLEVFTSDPPARSTVAVTALAFDARLEIECVAAAPEESAATASR
jgi:2-iminobutanoate/2-iminopropanoate deaminase